MSIAALVIAGLALVASAYAVIKGEIRAQQSHSQKLALGPAPTATREALVHAREAFQEIVTLGGRDTSFFISKDQRLTGQSLLDNADRTGSAELKADLARVAQTWNEAFGAAPGPPGPEAGAFVTYMHPEPQREHRLAESAEIAQRGLTEVATALARLNSEEAGT